MSPGEPKYRPGNIISFLGKRWWVKAFLPNQPRYVLVPIVSASYYVVDGQTRHFPQSEVEADGASWWLEDNTQPPRRKSQLSKKERRQRLRGERSTS